MNKASTSSKVSTVEKKTRQPRKTKQTEQVEVQLEEQPEQVEVVLTFKDRFEQLVKTTTEHISMLKSLNQELKKLHKEHDQLIKEASKKHKKKKTERDFSKPIRQNGFAEPVIVSDELYSFLTKTKATMKDTTFKPKDQEEYDNWPRVPVVKGKPVARTDVTSHLAKYIRENKLQNPEQKREIRPDAALKKIFSEPKEFSKLDKTKLVFTYLQLQKYVNHHFPKKAEKAV
jgi:chromatin remodeling complex protein RSC6